MLLPEQIFPVKNKKLVKSVLWNGKVKRAQPTVQVKEDHCSRKQINNLSLIKLVIMNLWRHVRPCTNIWRQKAATISSDRRSSITKISYFDIVVFV